jgi:hypothetical protein
MSLSDLASIAVIIQGIFFVVSIILVWYQLRENTKLVRSANTQKLVELSSPLNLMLAQDRALAELWRKGALDFEGLDDVDRERYFSLLTWLLVLHENIYHQWSKRLIDEDTFISWTRDLEYFAHRQNFDKYWDRINSFFEASFAEHVTRLRTPQTADVQTTETQTTTKVQTTEIEQTLDCTMAEAIEKNG